MSLYPMNKKFIVCEGFNFQFNLVYSLVFILLLRPPTP